MPSINVTVATLLLISVAPIFFVDIPAVADFINHLARMHVLANAGTPEENPFYEVTWNLYTNMAMDLLVPPLGRVIGVDVAAKAFLVASQILVVSGAVALEVVVKGRSFVAAPASSPGDVIHKSRWSRRRCQAPRNA